MEYRFTQSFLLELVEKLQLVESKKEALNVISSHLRFIVNLEFMTLLLEESSTHYQVYAPVVSKRIPRNIPNDPVEKASLDIEKHFAPSETVLSEKILESKALENLKHYFEQVNSWKVFPVVSGKKHFGYAFIGNNTSLNETETQSLRSVFEHLAYTLLRLEQQEDLEKINREVSRNNDLLLIQQDNLEQANRALIETLEEIHEAQEELLEVQKQASLGKVIRGIAHQINTPAGVCITASSSIDTMSNQLLTDLEQKKLTQKDLIQGISHIREVAKLLLLNSQKVTDLVGTFKHAAVDEWQEPATEFSLNKLLRDAKEQCDFRNETSTNISIDCAGDIIIFGYAAALRESLVLLMDNAIHFALLTQEDKATVSVKKKQDTVVITLIDTGKGMTKEQSEKLFEPFYTSRRSQNRIGLGAHIAHNLITQKCRGTIKLVSEPLQATHIDIEIPRLLKSL